MRNPKGRMTCYKFYTYSVVEKLIVSRVSVVSALTLIYTSRVLYALARLLEVRGISKEDAQSKPKGSNPE